MTPIRLIQVGIGRWGRSWAKLVGRHPELVDLVACVDMQPEMLELLQSDVDVATDRCFPTLPPALEATEADAVLVTASLDGHVPVVLAALEAGKHVLVEKPFAPLLADARRAVEMAVAQQRVLMVSQNYRFYPAAQAAAALVREEVLGPVGGVSLQFRKYANNEPPGTHWHYDLKHPLLMDMSIHHFDLMRFVLGQEPETIHCHAWNPSWSHFKDPAEAFATITFDGGAVVDYRGSWVSTAPPTLWSGAWQIECAGGVIQWTSRNDNSLAGDALTVRPRGKRPRRVTLPEVEHWDRAGSLAEFAAAIREGTQPTASGRDNLGSLALMFAAIESAESRRPVEILPQEWATS
jgi:predicted dehydrogenase